MINYKKITGIDVGEICFTPDMVIQACKDSVKAAIPLILSEVANKATIYVEDHKNDRIITRRRGVTTNEVFSSIDKESITSLQDTLEKQLGI